MAKRRTLKARCIQQKVRADRLQKRCDILQEKVKRLEHSLDAVNHICPVHIKSIVPTGMYMRLPYREVLACAFKDFIMRYDEGYEVFRRATYCKAHEAPPTSYSDKSETILELEINVGIPTKGLIIPD